MSCSTAPAATPGSTTRSPQRLGRSRVSDSKFHSGWTVGAGVEAFFAPQWSVKGEYLYRSLGGETYFSGTVPTGTLNFHTVQVGVNYHFSGPVVAKY